MEFVDKQGNILYDRNERIATLEEENKALRNALEEALERLAEVRRIWKGCVDSGIFSL